MGSTIKYESQYWGAHSQHRASRASQNAHSVTASGGRWRSADAVRQQSRNVPVDKAILTMLTKVSEK